MSIPPLIYLFHPSGEDDRTKNVELSPVNFQIFPPSSGTNLWHVPSFKYLLFFLGFVLSVSHTAFIYLRIQHFSALNLPMNSRTPQSKRQNLLNSYNHYITLPSISLASSLTALPILTPLQSFHGHVAAPEHKVYVFA